MADYLKHYGIKGMKWGVRRYRNADGTLTSEGRRRYESDANASLSKINKIDRSYDTKPGERPRYGLEEHDYKRYRQTLSRKDIKKMMNTINTRSLRQSYQKNGKEFCRDKDVALLGYQYIETLPKEKREAAEYFVMRALRRTDVLLPGDDWFNRFYGK